MKRLFRASWALVLLLAAIQTLRIGYADYLYRKDTFPSVERAAEIWSSDADFYARLADLDSPNDIAHLRRAVALNPGLSKSWIALGLRLELKGNADEAEHCYLEAARWDRQFLPAWTLANFYARRQDVTRFWPWARHAAQMSYDDIRPLLRLAFTLTTSPEVVLEKLIVPRRSVEHEFLYYLMAERLDSSSIAARILSKAGKEDLPPLLAWTNRLIETRRTAEARGLWDGLSDKRLIPYPHLALLTNADFSQDPLQAGFDWRITAPLGVNYARTDGGLRIEFSGKQPETFELASQYLDLTGGSYVLSFEYRTIQINTTTNLRWRMGEVSSAPLAAAENWTRSTRTFIAGPENRLILLEQRDPGTTRPEGVVYLRGLRLALWKLS
jgi:tetratricopeptide (TPR) repeat protein